MNQLALSDSLFLRPNVPRFSTQLLKWIGNKQRFAHEIIGFFPNDLGTYREPFLGSAAVLGTLAPSAGVGSDAFKPLIDIWATLKRDHAEVISWYEDRHASIAKLGKLEAYKRVQASFNKQPNGADLLFLSRSCYGGVIRFRKSDGYMSTPCGVHDPIDPSSFEKRALIWHKRIAGVDFLNCDYRDAMLAAKSGDVVYCDPPYSDSQSILYGAQAFKLAELYQSIADCKRRGVYVALSIDGVKRSGRNKIDINVPDGLFEREAYVDCGRSMLRRFQLGGQTLESEVVSDRLLLTY